MKHLGDITKINWAEVEPVDCVTGGSPCQDLSVAGKRAGLAGERSGLYMEQIRCVKELREKDVRNGRSGKFIRPRYMVWENVPGAFSSNGGKDFAAVLEEAVKIAEPEAADVPVPEKGWPSAGCLYDEMGRWSVAWRVHDAQFWGVPQRRKRISLVCDFGGLSAPEILFERKGMSGDFEQSGSEGKGTAKSTEGSVGGTEPILLESNQNHATIQTNGVCTTLSASMGMGGGYIPMVTGALSFQERAGKPGGEKGILIQNERIGALSTLNNQDVCYGIGGYNSKGMLSDNPKAGIYEADTSRTIDLNGGSPACNQGGIAVVQDIKCYDARGNGDGKTVCTLTGDHQNRVTDYTALCIGNLRDGEDIAGALMSRDYKGIGRYDSLDKAIYAVDCRNGYENKELSGTLQAKENGGQSLNYINPIRCRAIVRRLTPTECERLQGYPDGWTDIGEWVDSKGKKHKEADSPRYKALGNSIALPFWKWLLKRISAQYERNATLGSLFDGIGGFPMCWEQINGKGSARWASEIEEFPMAVTRNRFEEAEE